MRFYFCTVCRTTWQVGGDLNELEHLNTALRFDDGHYPCITPHCGGRLHKVRGSPVGYIVKELPIRAFYRAIHGFGTGEGEPAGVERFTELLRTKKIVEVIASPVGQPERVILNQLVLEDGTRLHFDSSSRGACCYYIEEHGPSCVEVVENELSTGATTEGGDPNREEAGRSPEAGNDSSTALGGHVHSTTATEQSSTRSMSTVSEAGGDQTRSDS